MRLVIDMQCVQSESRFRGIGRYAMGLCVAIAAALRADAEDELFLFINETMRESAARLRADFADIVPAARIRGFHSIGATSGSDDENNERRGVSEVIREAALSALRPDAVLVMSLFEGYGGSAVTSVGGWVNHLPTAVMLYDLIPMLAPDEYLANATMRSWYERKIASLRNADVLLSISTTAQEQAATLLGIADAKLTIIGTGLDSRFVPPESGDGDAVAAVFSALGVRGKAILYAGGYDRRKNLDALVEAYAGLDRELRAGRQLVLAGRCASAALTRLTDRIEGAGLRMGDDVVFTGHVTDEQLVVLYQHCELFVFPSLHEGFGLPALEAMSCGAPVLTVDTPAMREVQLRAEARAAGDAQSLHTAIDRVLRDPEALARLRMNHEDLVVRFGWDKVAERALTHLRRLSDQRGTGAPVDLQTLQNTRPRLAFVAPLPPAPSGIADYCAELIPALQAHYALELIVDQADVDTSWIPEWMPLRSLQWFEQHGDQFERVLYHFGNSPFHSHMFGLLQRFPGVVVLHDFFLGDLQMWREQQPGHGVWFEQTVAHSHGPAGRLLLSEEGRDAVVAELPCNLDVLEAADCVIVHSEYAAGLARYWYGSSIARRHVPIPFPRAMVRLQERHHARIELGVQPHELLICSFGMIAPHKLNHLILDAWDLLPISLVKRVRLTFVGANQAGVYGTTIAGRIARESSERLDITGHVSNAGYRTYLAAADVVVQLRGASRGETSAAVFDALGAGIALIVNDHASLSELPSDVVLKLPEQVTPMHLQQAIVRLADDHAFRAELAQRGRRQVRERHDPGAVAARYATAIETALRFSPRRHAQRLERFADRWAAFAPRTAWHRGATAQAMARALNIAIEPRLYVDVSAIADLDLRTGIQRTVRAMLLELLRNQPDGYRIEPVRTHLGDSVYRKADHYLSTLLGGAAASDVEEEVIDTQPGDVFLGLDLAGDCVTLMPDWFRSQSEHGVRIVFVAYDLLPVKLPGFFPKGMDIAFGLWLQTIGKFADRVMCISDAVADDLVEWLEENQPLRQVPLQVGSFHLGADLGASAPTKGLPAGSEAMLEAIGARRSFLMVGTVEPRKGHAQVVAAFDLLWAEGLDVGLVIVGKSGWLMDEFLTGVTNHAEFGTRLFWLERISDEFLDQIYPASTALIAASRGEGFGLPLIESAQHGLPIIARDLKVFREVAGDHAFYFEGTDADALATSVRQWIALFEAGKAPGTTGIRFYSWAASARQLMQRMDGPSTRQWQATAYIQPPETLPFDSLKLDWEGWSVVEPTHRWTEGKRSRIGFLLPRDSLVPKTLEIVVGTYDQQTIFLVLNDVLLYAETHTLADHVISVVLPRDSILLGEQNWLEIRVPGARSPGGGDRRRLGLYIKTLRLQ